MLVPFCVRVCKRRSEGGRDGEREGARDGEREGGKEREFYVVHGAVPSLILLKIQSYFPASELERCAEGIYLGCGCCRR